MSDPATIRIKDLKPGDRFRHDGAVYEVAYLNSEIVCKQNASKQKKKFALKSQARVELIESQARG